MVSIADNTPPRPWLTSIRLAVVFSVQSWLAETPETKSSTSTPGILSVGMARTSGPLKSSHFHSLLTTSE